MKKALSLFVLVSTLCAAEDKKPIEWLTGTLLHVSSERSSRLVHGGSYRNNVTHYTVKDGQRYIYVLKRSLRRRTDKELVVTVNASIRFAITSDENFLLIDDKEETHKVSLPKRSLRAAK